MGATGRPLHEKIGRNALLSISSASGTERATKIKGRKIAGISITVFLIFLPLIFLPLTYSGNFEPADDRLRPIESPTVKSHALAERSYTRRGVNCDLCLIYHRERTPQSRPSGVTVTRPAALFEGVHAGVRSTNYSFGSTMHPVSNSTPPLRFRSQSTAMAKTEI